MCLKEEIHKDDPNLKEYSLEEVRRHNTKTDKWLVIEGGVYDITSFADRHPGGRRIISHFAGEDATDAWVAFHNHKDFVSKHMKPLRIGRLQDGDKVLDPMIRDYRQLRATAEQMGLFKASSLFFIAVVAHIILLEVLAWWVLWHFGTGWIPYSVAVALMVTSQTQAGWTMHDFGHLSVFESTRWNHYLQIFMINVFKGGSADWWNYRHNQHHGKPNMIHKDPDVLFDHIFVLGKTWPVEWGKQKKGIMPFNYQHKYFHFILPPLLMPLYFNYEIPVFLNRRKLYNEMFWMAMYFVRFAVMYGPLLGLLGSIGIYFIVRTLESHWFVWVSQMNHLPMEVEKDQQKDWVTMQLATTCNVQPSYFNNWFTGHLNFQIEHHLFPTMPRDKFHLIAPLVKSFCDKHGLDYQNKELLQAFKDIITSLKDSGNLWLDAYHM